MTRRRIALLLLVIGALLAALSPWTIRSERVVAALSRQIKQGYGIALASNGRLTFTVLPMPTLVLSGVRLASADRMIDAEADELRAQLRLLPLFQGRLRLKKVWLAGSSISVSLPETPTPSVGGILAGLRERLGTEPGSRWTPRIDRFIVTDADIGIRDATGRELTRLKRASLMLNSPEPDGDLDLTASAEWNGEATMVSLSGLNLAAMREGRPQVIDADLAARTGKLSLDGRLTWSGEPSFAGEFRGQTASLARLARWSGLGMDLRDVERSASISAEGSIDLSRIQLTRASIEVGRDRLEGALALDFGSRPKVRATVAGNEIDLAWLGNLVDPRGSERLGADYDVRLSASTLVLGAARLRDAALSVQSAAKGIEVSLGRAGFAGGSLRGRISAILEGEGRDIRALGWAEGVDLERALADLAGIKGVTGTATGQFALDVAGDRSGSLASQARGRFSLQARDGELAGTALGDPGKRGAPASDWRSGRLRFSQAGLALEVGDGEAALRDGSIEAAGSQTLLAGRVNLETMTAALRVTTQAPSPGPTPRAPLILDLKGPLQRLTLSASATR